MATPYDNWLTSVDTEVEEYNRYWEAYFEKAAELFQDGKYNDEFIEFLEDSDWTKRYDDLREEFLEKMAVRLEKTDRPNDDCVLDAIGYERERQRILARD